MFSNIAFPEEDNQSMSIKQHLPVQHSTDISSSNSQQNMTSIRSCARGKFLRTNPAFFTHLVFNEPPITTRYTSAQEDNDPRQATIDLSTSFEPGDIHEHKDYNDPRQATIDLSTSFEPGDIHEHKDYSDSSAEPKANVEHLLHYDYPCEPINSVEYLLHHDDPSFEQINYLEYINKNTLVANPKKNGLEVIQRSHHYLSREQIEYEIFNMIKNILSFDQHQNCISLYIADGRCHFDILFEKLNSPNQSIWRYLEYNHKIYEKGIEMLYIMQAYFAPCHFLEENWKQKFSRYMENPSVYGAIGMHPLYAHHFNLKMELNIRRCISHPKVKAVGEIGLDYLSISRPSNDIQIKTFRQQIQMACTNQLPILIYSKNSFLEVLDILYSELPYDYPLCWRNFNYNLEELNMLTSRFTCLYFSCSPLVFIDKKMEKIIHHIDIKNIIPESVSPHLRIKECPNIWETHPIFVASVFKFIAVLHGLSIQAAAKQLVDNIEKFYKLL